MDNNKVRYQRLNAKLYNTQRKNLSFEQNLQGVIGSLIPNRAQQRNAEQNGGNADGLDKMQDDYNKKISSMQKQYMGMLSESEANSAKSIDALENKLQKSDESGLEMSNSLKDAIEKLYQERQEGQQQTTSQPTEGIEQEEGESAAATALDEVANYAEGNFLAETVEQPTTADAATTASAVKPITVSSVPVIASIALKIGQEVPIGKNKYVITNTFGQRDGKNQVAGISTSEHSKGVDVVGYDEHGNKSNLPIAVADGTIIGISRQGNGEPIHPSQGRAAGYMMHVKLDDGKVMTYMHLGKDVEKLKKSIINSRISRGDLLYTGDYSKGSGSMTGPHVKIRVRSQDEAGNLLSDGHLERNDPSAYIIHGKYREIPTV